MSDIKSVPFLTIIKDITAKFKKIKKQDYLESGEFAIVDQSKNHIAGYTNNSLKISNWNEEVVIFGDHTRIVKYIDYPIAIGADGVKVLKVDSSLAAPKYIFYFLKTTKIHNAGYSRHFKYLKALQVPLLPLSDQQKIASFLSRIENLIQKREESIRLLDELIKSSFLEMFQKILINTTSLNKRSFDEMAIIDTNMVDDFIKYADFPHIGIANIEKNTGRLINLKLVKNENLVSGKYLFDERHILYSKIRPNLNKVAAPTFKGLLSADGYPILPIDTLVNKEFLTYLLRSDYFLNFILDHSDRANIPKVNKKALLGFGCNIPPKPLQDKFASIVTRIEQTKETYQTSLDELNNLFNSVAKKAFKGELDVSKITLLDKKISQQELQVLDEERILELIKLGDFKAQDHVNESQSYDEIRDLVLKLLSEKKITQRLTSKKKIILETST